MSGEAKERELLATATWIAAEPARVAALRKCIRAEIRKLARRQARLEALLAYLKRPKGKP